MKRTARERQIQRTLTPEQQAAAKSAQQRFEEAYSHTHLSTEPADEQAAEDFLRHAYERAGLTAPPQIHWLDGPRQLVAALTREHEWLSIEDSVRDRISPSVWDSVKDDQEMSFIETGENVSNSIDYRVTRAQIRAHSLTINFSVWESVRERVGERIWQAVAASVNRPLPPRIRDCRWGIVDSSLWHSIRAYDEAPLLALKQFFVPPFAPKRGRPLAHFNQLVSGYWLGKDVALVVRRPRLLSRDAEGRLHSATGRAVEYHDGWGFYAWHGARVPEKVILAPDTLTREDFLNEENIEARRMIQERMGQRFVWELEGTFIDGGPQGDLYEVELHDDPQQVARYVHVQDASTPHQYYLRVPPTIQTAAEAIAWSFGMTVEEYHPAQET
jgi:hypothetical protein